MGKISITLSDLSANEATAILELYASIRGTKLDRSAAITGTENTTSTAPAAPAASTTSPDGTERDDRGVPHDPRFHAPGKGKTKAGNWSRKKGVDVAACDAYEAQFIGTTTTAPAAPAMPAMPAMPGFPGLPAGPAYMPVDYNTFVQLYQALANSGKLSGEEAIRIMKESGVGENAALFVTDDEKRAHAYHLLKVVSEGR